jgi:hypothetical protein
MRWGNGWVFSAALLLGGCATATVNHPYNTGMLNQFQQGVTTLADVERVYGTPSQIVTNSQNGHSEAIYAYSHVSGPVLIGRADVQSQGIVFVFDASGRMLYYRTSRGASRVR